MNKLERVRLIGGPYDGQDTMVEPNRVRLLMVSSRPKLVHGWGDDVTVEETLLETYRRRGRSVFEHCATQVGIGDVP
jgi:hypothetical protein